MDGKVFLKSVLLLAALVPLAKLHAGADRAMAAQSIKDKVRRIKEIGILE